MFESESDSECNGYPHMDKDMRNRTVRNRQWVLPLSIGIPVSAAGLYLALRHVPLTQLIDYVAAIQIKWVLLCLLTVLMGFVIRVVRWRFILKSVHDIGFWGAFHPLMIAFMMNCVLPGRVGELARPAILKNEKQLPFSSGLASVAAERLLDMGMILLLFFITFSMVDIDPNMSITFGSYRLDRGLLQAIAARSAQIGLLLVLGLVLLHIRKTRDLINQIIIRAPSILFFLNAAQRENLKQRIARPLTRWIEHFADGLAMLRSPVKLIYCLSLSVVIWLLAALSYYLFALGCPGIDVSLAEMTAVMVIICIFIALPSVPGYWGIWEAGGVFALRLFGIPTKEAAGFTLANHAIQMIPIVIIGLFSALMTGVNIWQTSLKTEQRASG